MVLYGASGIANNPELTRLLLDAGADVNEMYAEGEKFATETLYHTAEHPDNRCLEMILSAKPYGHIVRYCIFRALDHENPEAVRLFLKHGADPNHRVSDVGNRTTLHFAIWKRRSAEVIQILLAAGADPALLDEEGRTPFQVAMRMGREDLLPLFAGLTGCETTEEDRAVFALVQGDRSVKVSTIPAGLLGAAAMSNDVRTMDALLAAGVDINEIAEGGAPALHDPAWFGMFDGVRSLVERGADIHLKNPQGGDALGATIHGSENCCSPDGGPGMRIAEEAHPGDYPRIVEYLITRGAKLPAKIWGGSEAVKEVLRKHGVAEED